MTVSPQTPTRSSRALALLGPVAFVLLWSGGYPVAKVALKHGDPFSILALRYAIALAILAVMALALRIGLPRTRREWLGTAAVGLLIQGGYFGCSFLSFRSGTSAGTVALILSLMPVLVGLLAPSAVGERVGLRRWIGLILGLIGAGLVIFARSRIEATGIAGLAFAVGSLCCMTAATLLEKRLALALNPISANLIQYLCGLAAIVPLMFAFETPRIEPTVEFVAAIAYLSIGNSIVAISLLLAMIRAGEASRVSALLFLVPPIAALMAYGLIGEAMPPLAWAGMAIAALGVLIATFRGAPKPTRT